MPKFLELIDTISKNAKAKLNSSSSEEEINAVNDLTKNLDELKKEHESLEAENGRLKDKIIESIRSVGSGEPPADEKQEKSLEEIIASVAKQKQYTKEKLL